jgi:hypothetical protein
MGLEDQLSTVNDAYLNEKMAAYRSAGADARKKTEIVDNVANVFQNTFSNVFEMTESASNDYKAAAFYNSRTADFKGLQQAVATRTDGVSEELDADINNARRQSQINEWSAYNKLDTLFVSQLTFIALVFLAPLLYLKSLYILPSGVFWGIAMLIFIAVLMTIIWRVQYTDKSRSNQFWHRRRFGEYSKTPSTVCT